MLPNIPISPQKSSYGPNHRSDPANQKYEYYARIKTTHSSFSLHTDAADPVYPLLSLSLPIRASADSFKLPFLPYLSHTGFSLLLEDLPKSVKHEIRRHQ